jgi:hypothetical protein
MHPDHVAPSSPDAELTGRSTATQWSLVFRGRKGHLLDAALGDGCWIVGSGEWADVIVPCPGVLPEHLRLEIDSSGLVATRLQPDMGTAAPPTLTLTPGDSGSLQLGPIQLDLAVADVEVSTSEGTADTPTTQSGAPLSIATALASPIAAAAVTSSLSSAIEESARRVRLMVLGLVGLLAAVALGAAVILPADVRATNPPAPTLTERRAALEPLLAAYKLDHIVRVSAPESANSPSALTGRLPTPDACERYRHLRSAAGAMHFVDRVACLPELQASLAEYLTGLGITVKTSGGRLLLEGTPNDPSARARIDAAVGSLNGLVDVEANVVFPDKQASLDESASRQLRSRIVAAHSGDPGYVVMKSGDYVYVGGSLAAGIELESVEVESIHVRMGSNRVEVQL